MVRPEWPYFPVTAYFTMLYTLYARESRWPIRVDFDETLHKRSLELPKNLDVIRSWSFFILRQHQLSETFYPNRSFYVNRKTMAKDTKRKRSKYIVSWGIRKSVRETCRGNPRLTKIKRINGFFKKPFAQIYELQDTLQDLFQQISTTFFGQI